MTAPSDDQGDALLAFRVEHFAAFNRWYTRAKWIGYIVAGAAFVIVLIAMSRITPNSGTLGVFAALAAAIAVLMAMLTIVIPRLPMPVVRCPFCGGRVPLIESPKPFVPFVMVLTCPTCQRILR